MKTLKTQPHTHFHPAMSLNVQLDLDNLPVSGDLLQYYRDKLGKHLYHLLPLLHSPRASLARVCAELEKKKLFIFLTFS